jgi:integrase/transposase
MINAAFVRECKPRAKMYEVTCDGLPGFILRVLPTGKKVALVRYRVAGKDHRERIGLLGPTMSLEEARRRAAVMLAGVAAGVSADETSARPAPGKHSAVEQPESARSHIDTVRELAERFVRLQVDARLASGTAERYRRHIKKIIVPQFGDRDWRSVKRSEINALHVGMKDTPGKANNVLMTMSSLFTWILKDLEVKDGHNPAHGIEHFPTKKHERFLTPEERQRIQVVIDKGLKTPKGRKGALHIGSVWALDLLALTGRRRNEIIFLKWEMIDWQHSIMDLPDTKGGQLKIPVSKHVLGLLKFIHDQTGNPRTGYVLRGPRGTRIKSINRTWDNIRTAAGIPDVRLHDLRHSFASDALMCGLPLAVVGEMLGHKDERTTKRYAHLANHVVREGLDAAADRIVAASRPPTMLTPPPFERLTDREWKRIAKTVEATRRTCGGKRTDLRQTVDAVRWVLHSGAKWRELPNDLGPASTCWRWYERWSSDGTWAQITAALDLPEIEAGREPRHLSRGSARSKPTIEVEAVEVKPPTARRGRLAGVRQSV